MIELLLYIFLPVVAEFAMLGLAIVWAPPRIVRTPNWVGRWLVGIAGVLMVITLFHGRQVLAKALIALEHPDTLFISNMDRYCEPFGVVSFPNAVADLDDLPDGLPLEPAGRKTPSDFVMLATDCGGRCLLWLRSEIASKVYVGVSRNDVRLPYSADGRWLGQVREALPSSTPECQANFSESIWTTGMPTLFREFADRPLVPIPSVRLTSSCIQYGGPPSEAPLVIANERQFVTDLPLGLQRVEFQNRLVEHFSQEVIAQSTKVAIYGAAPTFRPDARRQHESVGRLMSEYDLMNLYRTQNCSENPR